MKRLFLLATIFVLILTAMASAQDDDKKMQVAVRKNTTTNLYEFQVPGDLTWHTSLTHTMVAWNTVEFYNSTGSPILMRNTVAPSPHPGFPNKSIPAGGTIGPYTLTLGSWEFKLGDGTGADATLTIDVVTSVPALSTYGLIGLLLLLGASAVFIIRKRRLTA